MQLSLTHVCARVVSEIICADGQPILDHVGSFQGAHNDAPTHIQSLDFAQSPDQAIAKAKGIKTICVYI